MVEQFQLQRGVFQMGLQCGAAQALGRDLSYEYAMAQARQRVCGGGQAAVAVEAGPRQCALPLH